MIEKKDYHIHSKYSDGKDSLEDIVLWAIKNGIKEIGFSDHSYTSFNDEFCIKKEDVERYRKEVKALNLRYANEINILLGIEQDYYSSEIAQGYDYVIGSVHFIKVDDDVYSPVDKSLKDLLDCVEKYFNGDVYSYIERYFEIVSDVVNKTNADIIGHFDLVSKFNDKESFFDVNHPRYINAWKKAIDNLIKTKKPFEINVGAISRGYKKEPYPSFEIQKYIKSKNGTFIYTSDSHKKETLCFDFEKYCNL